MIFINVEDENDAEKDYRALMALKQRMPIFFHCPAVPWANSAKMMMIMMMIMMMRMIMMMMIMMMMIMMMMIMMMMMMMMMIIIIIAFV
jgi:hypothetical protein